MTADMITPLGKRVALRPIDDKMSDSIVIPEVVQQRKSAEVIALGTGEPGFSFELKVGDIVLIPPQATFFKQYEDEGGKEILIVPEESILALMETT